VQHKFSDLFLKVFYINILRGVAVRKNIVVIRWW